jgi:hypothetical protein
MKFFLLGGECYELQNADALAIEDETPWLELSGTRGWTSLSSIIQRIAEIRETHYGHSPRLVIGAFGSAYLSTVAVSTVIPLKNIVRIEP